MSEKKTTFKELKDGVAEAISNGKYCKYDDTTPMEWNGVSLHIRKYLTLKDMVMFVRDVVSSSFDKETKEYLPEATDFAIKCSVLEYYAGIKTPKNIDDIYKIVYGTDLILYIMQRINRDQYNTILTSITKKVEHIAQSNIQAVIKQVDEASYSIKSLTDNLGEIFKNVDSETMSNLFTFIGDGSIDEYKIAKALSENMAPVLSEA